MSAGRPRALITGASSGIGAAFARKLAMRGYDPILLARREDRLRTLASSLPTAAEILIADLATAEGVASAERAIRECDRLELLVNNAGFGTLGRFWESDLADQVRMHQVHVTATLRLTHAALGKMVPCGRGAVINVSSLAAFGQSEGNVSYCATKAWINAFTKGLDMELRSLRSPVTVQALCPGFTMTEFHDVLGIDRTNIPNVSWMEADLVVEASLEGLDQGKLMVIPGRKYRMDALARRLPQGIVRRLARFGGSRT